MLESNVFRNTQMMEIARSWTGVSVELCFWIVLIHHDGEGSGQFEFMVASYLFANASNQSRSCLTSGWCNHFRHSSGGGTPLAKITGVSHFVVRQGRVVVVSPAR